MLHLRIESEKTKCMNCRKRTFTWLLAASLGTVSVWGESVPSPVVETRPLAESSATEAVNAPSAAEEQAKKRDAPAYRHDVNVSGGCVSLVQGVIVGMWGDLASALNGQTETSRLGVYGLQYGYYANRWCLVGVKVSLEWEKRRVYTDKEHAELDYDYPAVVASLMPSVRFVYLNRRVARLYSGIDMGVSLSSNLGEGRDGSSSSVQPLFALNLTPIGVQVGTRVYGMAELNLGTDALVKVGVGARF